MKQAISKSYDAVLGMTRKAHYTLLNKCEEYSHSPIQRRVMMASALISFGTLMTVEAHAQAAGGGGGLAGMVDTASVQGDAMKASIGKIFAAFGFAGAGYGGYNGWRKSKEGEQSQIKAMQIIGPLLGGAALGATGYVMIKAGESMGITSSQQGGLPN